MSSATVFGMAAILLVLPSSESVSFRCHKPLDADQSTLDAGQLSLSVQIEGDPSYYVPEKMYKVTVQSSKTFDTFMLLGVFAVSPRSATLSSLPNMPFGGPRQSRAPPSESLQCSLLHSHFGDQSVHELSFLWPAPHHGTGCIRFLATAMSATQVLFKDITTLQLCEEGAAELVPPVDLSGVHEAGIILRDNFDSQDSLHPSVWLQNSGFTTNETCDVISGRSASTCDNSSSLETVSLNLTTSSLVQFGLRSCGSVVGEITIQLVYGTHNCTQYDVIDSIQLQSPGRATLHMVHLPREAKQDDVCIGWRSAANQKTGNTPTCWSLDNVLVVNTADQPIRLQESFDPIDPSLWLFLPGGKVKSQCQSDAGALVFDDPEQQTNSLTSRDLHLPTEGAAMRDDAVVYEDFERGLPDNWYFKGGYVGSDCYGDDGNYDNGAIFSGQAKTRILCTPLVDMTDVGNVRFNIQTGCNGVVDVGDGVGDGVGDVGDGVGDGDVGDESVVFVYAEDEEGHSFSLTNLHGRTIHRPRVVSLVTPLPARRPRTRVCWTQKTHGGFQRDVWVIDHVALLPELPTAPAHYVQFLLTLKCGATFKNTSVAVEMSVDRGVTWGPLYVYCEPDTHCMRAAAQLRDTFSWPSYDRWTRVTLPLPYAALAAAARLRWRQTNRLEAAWAIDDVYVGACPQGCSGRGQCMHGACRCEAGYQGPGCGASVGPLPTLLMDSMATADTVTTNFAIIEGAELGYRCGVVASGRAAVFTGDGRRRLQTIDLDMSRARFVQFSVRLGSESVVGQCAPPDRQEETVSLHYTCDGGIMWKLLRELNIRGYTQPMMLSVPLPPAARGPVCRLQWAQAAHSGRGHDVWAIDDVAVTETMFNALNVDLQSPDDLLLHLDTHLSRMQPYCGRQHVLGFTEPYEPGESRYVATTAVSVTQSHVLQLELVMACSYHFPPSADHILQLEFSTNHGMTWQLVRSGCWPPRSCAEYHAASVLHAAQHRHWGRVTVLLPPHTWSGATRFRVRQARWGVSDSWAVARIYVGPQCPHMCHGNGYCIHGDCQCDDGYYGPSCEPKVPLPTSLHTDFSLMSQLASDWSAVLGAETVGPNQGCGPIVSGESLFFFKGGPRQAVTSPLDLTHADFLQFTLQLGGDADLQCYGAETRQESVLVQYTTDGGATWRIVKELQGADYRKPTFAHLPLPAGALTSHTAVRWWQPSHSGADADQWALDQVVIGSYSRAHELQADFELSDSPQAGGPTPPDVWLTITDAMFASFCGSQGDSLVLMSESNDKMAMTRDLRLEPGDVIQFRINVGCSKSFSYKSPVLLEYSHDSGLSWQLVEEPCYHGSSCHDHLGEGTVYHVGPYGAWTLVTVPVTPKLAARPMNLRWWQAGGATSFSLDDVWVGTPCEGGCGGHGTCVGGTCRCEHGFTGSDCSPPDAPPSVFVDRFEDVQTPGGGWARVQGGGLGVGCGPVGSGNSLYFDGDGPREARTVPLSTTHIKVLQFAVRIGTADGRPGCSAPTRPAEGVVVDYSSDSGQQWTVLKQLDPLLHSAEPSVVTLPLPAGAKTNSTTLRWWQPLSDAPRAQWALDDVVVALNDSAARGFEELFAPGGLREDVWAMALNAVPRLTCSAKSTALEFSKNGRMRYAETWDYVVTPSTFLQFDIAMGCSGTYSTLYSVRLQYSTDMGGSWAQVTDPCRDPAAGCHGYSISGRLVSEAHANWTRVTLYMPPAAVSHATRFRWLQETVGLRGNVWALDNIYLGEGCPWMCSGHGYCRHGYCVCDPGYFGVYCVPQAALPNSLRAHFDDGMAAADWPEVYGGEATDLCGPLVGGKALTFHRDNLRMAVTRDLDVSIASSLEFTIMYGCDQVTSTWPRDHLVIVQYSNNGGILWNLLEEVKAAHINEPKFVSIPLPTPAQTNATRFRLWQPQHDGAMQSVWAVDDVYVGGLLLPPDGLYDQLDTSPDPHQWRFWPGGATGHYCQDTPSPDITLSVGAALVFDRNDGQRALTTTDLQVNELTVLQFELNVGCSAQSSHHGPVRLEYSTDRGATWRLVVAPCGNGTGCAPLRHDPTIYYPGSEQWRRMMVPLEGAQLCGVARFRWTQGYHDDASSGVPAWGVRAVYIGLMCEGHCGGRGECVEGVMCQCQTGHDGVTCDPITHTNPTHLLDDFETAHSDSNQVWGWVSGGEPTGKCGTVLAGLALHFTGRGVRAAVTPDLNLSTARLIQFYISVSCPRYDILPPPGDPLEQPVLLQYSVDGGISWHTLQQHDYADATRQGARYVVLEVTRAMRTAATRVRWYQPSASGLFVYDWAIDQVYIGGDVAGTLALQSDRTSAPHRAPPPGPALPAPPPAGPAWLMHPGAVREATCGWPTPVLHFTGEGESRFAVTNDVMVTDSTYLQFYLVMGCGGTGSCFGVAVQYSRDLGRSWTRLTGVCGRPGGGGQEDAEALPCRPTDGVFTADLFGSWTRVTLQLPAHTKSKATRFRWIQEAGFGAADTWAVTRLYVGDECMCTCAGHGRCNRGVCVCDSGWGGEGCSRPLRPLPVLLADAFPPGAPDAELWGGVHGGAPSAVCGPLGAGTALHFTGACSRQLITRDLDLRGARFLQFNLRYGCVAMATSRDEDVVVEVSSNGGNGWGELVQLGHGEFTQPGYVLIELPKHIQREGVRIRWRQPHHAGENRSDWAIDNVVVGGKESNPNEIKDTFSDGPRQYVWLQRDNVRYGGYCGTKYAVTGVPQPGESVTLMTADVSVKEGYILQFSIAVGCNSSWDAHIAPVHLEYSTDYGMRWRPLVTACVPHDTRCGGVAREASVHHATAGWRRVTVPLEGDTVSGATRFRWRQASPGAPPPAAAPQHWALDDVFLGPACEALCGGHGQCDYPDCICDRGYTGPHCEQAAPIQNYLRSSFEPDSSPRGHPFTPSSFTPSPGTPAGWGLVQGGRVGAGCGTPPGGGALVMAGPGLRQAVTNDLDLRNARFVQYTAQIGGPGGGDNCSRPHSRNDTVYLQYSTNGGIQWRPLHELDRRHYWRAPQRDYVELPRAARSSATRVRWFQQPAPEGATAATWLLDDVYIGGAEINHADMFESFEGVAMGTSVEFSPGGGVERGVCGRDGGSLVWGAAGGAGGETRSVTTQQLIVQDGYMLQFKLVVGCVEPAEACTLSQAVLLQFNTDPAHAEWHLVYPRCLWNGHETNMECRPYDLSPGTVYRATDTGVWTRLTLRLPPKVFSSRTRFRWREEGEAGSQGALWSVDDVTVGEACPELCHGRGDCVRGKCRCDEGFTGESCAPRSAGLLPRLSDGFEGGVTAAHWARVAGGGLGLGCGALLPHAHGKNLYFDGCGVREAVTVDLDTTKARKVMFVLQIGSRQQTPTCNVHYRTAAPTGMVVLQYSVNRGIDWHVLATHDPREFLAPKKVGYDLVGGARAAGVRLRWWQPEHRGAGHDQWAVDHVEVVMTRQARVLQSQGGENLILKNSRADVFYRRHRG